MTRKEYVDELLKIYAPVRTLSEKDGASVMVCEHRSAGKKLVLRSASTRIEAYERLVPIRSQYLPEVYDVIDCSDGMVVLEEFIDGVTLAETLDTRLYTYREALPVIESILSALYVLHGMRIIHRDVKPENVMMTAGGRTVLVDLGASRILSGSSRDTVIMGTVGFLPPEQLGLSESDERADIYSVGVLMNVMMTGRFPIETIPGGKPGRIIKKCLSIMLSQRYQSAEEMLRAL